jgi:outer membrane protein assembly factor BamB
MSKVEGCLSCRRSHSFAPRVALTCLLLLGSAIAVPSINLSRKIGPPTSEILISGNGFERNVGVDIYFDTKDEALVVTNNEGEFHGAAIHAPREATPGEHWITALERNNDKGDQEPFAVNTNWPQFRFALDHDGVNPDENVLKPNNVAGLELKWSYPTNVVYSSPAVSNGVVYAASWDYKIYALNANTGSELWSYNIGSYASDSSPAVANGVVYVGSEDGYVYALKASNGDLVWRVKTGSAVNSSPAVANEIVYVCSTDVYAFNARTGATLWTYPAACNFSSPVVVNGVVYIGSGDYNVYALDANSGTKLWSYTTGGFLNSSPAVADGRVFIGSEDYKVYALDAISGANLWIYPTAYRVFSSPAVADGIVYVGSEDGYLYALNGATGSLVWKFSNGQGQVYGSPAVANGVVYAATYSYYAVDARNGTQLWSYPNDGTNVVSSPAVANGAVYFESGFSNTYAFGLPAADTEYAHPPDRPALGTLQPDLTLRLSRSTTPAD